MALNEDDENDTIPDDRGTQVFDPDMPSGEAPAPLQPLYQIYEDSRIAVGRNVGKMWKRRIDAAIKSYEETYNIWNTVFQYYNNNQMKVMTTPRGQFTRGDCTENIIFSNLNVMMPAVYSKDPDVTCTTEDKEDEDFCKSLQKLINALFKRKDLLNAKPKVKKAIGMGLLTNFGILKLDFTKKDDSREHAQAEMTRITDELKTVGDKSSESDDMPKPSVEDLYGQLEALEENMEVMEASGPKLSNVLSHNLIIDPHAQQPDGLDGTWMCERLFYPTAGLNQRFTKPEDPDEPSSNRVLIYKPTHKAVFAEGSKVGERDDALGMVMEALSGPGSVTAFQNDERAAYENMYFTECFLVWDMLTRRVMLFHKDDWKWPIWVWDDPLKMTRFFPYFIISYTMSTGGTVQVGETAYYLDQQDEINDINRQLAKIRKTIFDFFYYNTNAADKDEVEKFVSALRGFGNPTSPHLVGIDVPEGMSIKDMIGAFVPPALEYEQLFDKAKVLETVNRTTNTSDALRGVQFKTNTNVSAVNTYQESMRLSIGAKVDVAEDCVGDVALALAELCVQNYQADEVAGLIGKEAAKAWKQMDVPTFRTQINLELVAGSMEKPNSVFRKKEAVEVAQAIGQFAQAAPGAVLRIMLRVLQQAFTEVVIKDEDWNALDQEIAASMTQGVSTPGGGGAPAPGGGGGDLEQAAMNLPDAVKQEIVKMHQAGKSPQEIAAYIQQQVQQAGANDAPGQNEPVS